MRFAAALFALLSATAVQSSFAAGDGDSQGDAKVGGTKFNATAVLPCKGHAGLAAMQCEAGVVRNPDGSAEVSVMWPDGFTRVLVFDAQGKAVKPSPANASGFSRKRDDADNTLVTLGTEQYTVPDVLILGD